MKKLLIILGILAVIGGGIAVWYFVYVGRDRGPSTFDADEVEVTEYCQPDDDGVWPEGIGDVSTGHTNEYGWGEGGGCVHRPIREVWAGLFDIPELVRDGVARHELRVLEPEPPYSHRFHLDYEVDDFITVKWTNLWTHEILEGSLQEPVAVQVHYRRVEGSRLMPYWDGTILMRRLTDDITAVFVHEEIDTPRGQAQDEETAGINVKGYFRDAAAGQPNWELLDGE